MIRPIPTPESARASLARLQAALTQYQRDNPPVRRTAEVLQFPAKGEAK